MDAQQFLTEFGHVANAPGGVAELRKMIYQLAVTGSLTQRTDGADHAGALLNDIGLTRQRLVREKKYKRITVLESEPVRSPHGIVLPETWRWTRLLDIGEISPRNEAPDDQLAAFMTMNGVPQTHRGAMVAEARRWGEIKKGFTHFANDDVVLAKITPCFENGKAAVIANLPGDFGIGAGTTELHVFRAIHEGILPQYVYVFLRSPLFVVEGEKSMTGTAGQKRLPTRYFATSALPLPPTEEQHRIVAKVDELMTLCDMLESQQQARRRLQNSLRQSALVAVGAATNPHDLQAAWTRLAENFGHLFSIPDDVENLRKLVLDLVIRGLLSEKRDSDEPVDLLVDRCLGAKADRLASGEIRRKTIAATDVVPLELDVPEHWRTVPLNDLFRFIDYRGQTPPKSSAGVVLVTAKNVRPGRLAKSPVEYISERSYSAWMTRGYPKIGDLLFTTEAPLGNVARIEEQPDFALAQRIIALQPFADFNTQCMMYFMMSPVFQELLERNSTGMTAKGIKAAKLKQLEIPVPPVHEQARIVDEVGKLMKLCDGFESQLRHANELGSRFAIAAIASLTGITIEQPDATAVKPPQTELIAPLRLGQVPDLRSRAPLATILARHEGEMSAKDLWQRFGGEIDAFYTQLKTEVGSRWILEPEPAEMRELPAVAEVA